MTSSPGVLRIAFVAPFGLRHKTTIWARTLPLAKRLVERGCAVTILIPPWDSPQDAGRRWVEAGVEIGHVTLTGSLPATAWRLLHEIDELAPAIVHIVKPRAHAGVVQWLLRQRNRLHRRPDDPLLLLDADDWEQDWNGVNQYAWPVARFLAWQEEWGLRHADGVTVASRWLESKMHVYAPGCPTLYLPNGITAAAAPAFSPSHPRSNDVLFFSRFVEIEPSWLAHFWSCLHELEPNARLLVAGTPVVAGLDLPFRAALDASGPAGASVQWLGYVEAAQTAALMASVGCAIFPAAPTPLQLAKYSVRLATTLLAGAPVVASATGEQAAYGAAGAARLLPPDASPADFAAAVIAVLRQPETQQALAAQARERLLQRYRWDDLGDQLLEFYEEMLRSRMVVNG